MNELFKLKVVTNPMDFGLGFAGIAYNREQIALVVFSQKNCVINFTKYRSLRNAIRGFNNLYARKKGIKAEWSSEKINYLNKPMRKLIIDDSNLDNWRKLGDILKGSKNEKIEYYGLFN